MTENRTVFRDERTEKLLQFFRAETGAKFFKHDALGSCNVTDLLRFSEIILALLLSNTADSYV